MTEPSDPAVPDPGTGDRITQGFAELPARADEVLATQERILELLARRDGR